MRTVDVDNIACGQPREFHLSATTVICGFSAINVVAGLVISSSFDFSERFLKFGVTLRNW